jgi:isoquinoline 1-oxidoreductase alpha subunit
VHINGTALRSCQRRASTLAGVEVTTIEGLSADGTHALQRAWEELDVPQCGYCQAGQLMSASALLAKNANPTDAEIDAAMNGNICRCATYLRIRAGIHRAAAMKAADSNGSARRGSSGDPRE